MFDEDVDLTNRSLSDLRGDPKVTGELKWGGVKS